jgi:hypothetical protein
MEFYSAIKKNEIMLPEEKNNGLGDNHPKWNKPVQQRQTLHAFFHL